jgi:hypothetical protein
MLSYDNHLCYVQGTDPELEPVEEVFVTLVAADTLRSVASRPVPTVDGSPKMYSYS